MGLQTYWGDDGERFWFKPRQKVSESQEIIQPKIRKTYKQNWSIYTLHQTTEKLMVYKIFNDVIDYLDIHQVYKGNGRPNVNLKDMLKCLCIQIYNGPSSRRNNSELILVQGLGYINKTYHFTTICKYLRKQELTHLLHYLYKTLAEPLKTLENYFSIDATGFSTFDRKKWIEVRLETKQHKDYKKLHALCGNLTNVVVSVEVTEGTQHESPYFKVLLRDAAKRFSIKEICADSGYLSRENCNISQELNIEPFILPKKNSIALAKGSQAWHKMIRLWKDNLEVFKEHYHRRSNIETVFSMIKKKFRHYVRSKDDIAKINEILCLICCHNACVLAEALLAYDLKLDF